jgi:Zn-dependent metalloprotease
MKMCRKSTLVLGAIVLTFACAFSQGITDRAARRGLETTFEAQYGAISVIKWSTFTNYVALLQGGFATGHVVTDSSTAVQTALDFLDENSEMFGTAGADLRLQGVVSVVIGRGYDVRFAEYHDGVRVERALTSVLIERDGTVFSVGNGFIPCSKVPVVPALSSDDAVSIAAQLDDFPMGPEGEPSVELVIYPVVNDSALVCHLAWRVQHVAYTYFIDAADGSQVARWDNLRN